MKINSELKAFLLRLKERVPAEKRDEFAKNIRAKLEEIEIDDLKLTGSSIYLFATVLEHFFALYCSINSFTRVLIRAKSKEGYLKRCPPRAGEKILL